MIQQCSIPSAKDVRSAMMQNETYKKAVAEQLGWVLNSIEFAKNRGHDHTVFSVKSDYEHEIKRMFLDKGYSFRPTGYCGGVWQASVDICW
jgi:hypothetical protein